MATGVVVAGGGPVGSTLALALGAAGVDVALVDPGSGAMDERPIALSASSVRILDTLGVWKSIAPSACAISTVHVSEKGRFGMVRLHAREHGVDALGYVTPASAIHLALEQALTGVARVRRTAGARILNSVVEADGIRVMTDGDLEALPAARLLVAAQGGASTFLGALGVSSRPVDYHQSAVVCTVTPGRPHQGTAYERFTRSGPLALLPLASGDCALVWTLPEDQALQVSALDDASFLAAVREAFGQRLGVLRNAGPRLRFPLALVRSDPITLSRTVLVGNAANRLHPVAGQGLNLGLRDAATLAELVAHAQRQGGDPGGADLLGRYASLRRQDHNAVVRFTDLLARGFSVSPGPVGAARSLAMLTLDLVPPLGRVLARRAMGLAGRQPRLVRGVMP